MTQGSGSSTTKIVVVIGVLVAALVLGVLGAGFVTWRLLRGSSEPSAGPAPATSSPSGSPTATPSADPTDASPTPSETSDPEAEEELDDELGLNGGGLGDGAGGSGGSGGGGGRTVDPDRRAYAPRPPSSQPLLATRWGRGEKSYLFAFQELPAGFRGAAYWGCLKVDASSGSSRWACRDDGGTFPTRSRHTPPTIGRVELNACAEPCPIGDRAQLRRHAGTFAAVTDGFTRLDARTWFVSRAGEDGRRSMALARSIDTDRDRRPDHVLLVFLDAHRADVAAAGKTMRDVYDYQY